MEGKFRRVDQLVGEGKGLSTEGEREAEADPDASSFTLVLVYSLISSVEGKKYFTAKKNYGIFVSLLIVDLTSLAA